MAKIIKKYNTTKYEYTEGYGVEQDIYNYILNYSNDSYCDIFEKDDRWTVFYHLTDIRKGIISWYPFEKEKDCLEIGGGMGSMTDLLCEKCNHVTTIEMSENRAEALYNRHKEKDNLDIYVGNFDDIKINKKFDYITLIGVLEYQGRYSESKNPYIDFLKKLKSFLKKDGKILIAIENRFGLKYWCGTPEDHIAIPFDGVNGYERSNSACTFGKQELSNIISEAGFQKMKFYYPLPDYKLPQLIYSDDYLPKMNIKNRYRQYYLDYRSLVLNENKLLLDVIENNVFPFFSNSFFVECTNGDVSNVIFASNTYDRKKELQLSTIIKKDEVIKKALNKKSEQSLINCINNINELKKNGIDVIKQTYNKGFLTMPYENSMTLDEYILHEIKKNNIENVYKVIDDFYSTVLKSSEESTNNRLVEEGIIDKKTKVSFGKIMKNGYIDLLFHNSFYKNKKIVVFDQEFVENDIPANFMLFRSFKNLYYGNEWIEKIIPFDKMKKKYDLKDVWEYYEKLDIIFLENMKNNNVNKVIKKYYNYNPMFMYSNQDNLFNADSLSVLKDNYCALQEKVVLLENEINHLKNDNECLKEANNYLKNKI